MKIKRVVLMFMFLTFTIAIPLWASVGDDPEYGHEMPGRERDIISTTNGQDDSDTGYQRALEAITVVHVTGTPEGFVGINIPGHGDLEIFDFSTDYDVEFFITPPQGAYFSPETALVTFGNIEVTFGPIVRGCGRLFFVILPLAPDNQGESPRGVDIIFDPGYGRLPDGESGSLSGPANLNVAYAPVPHPPQGYAFEGWYYNGVRMSFPFYAGASMVMEARYREIPPGDAAGTHFNVSFRPAGGIMPAGEPMTRSVPVNTMLRDLPIPMREGHHFGNWMIGTQLATPPILVTSDLDLSAVWIRADNVTAHAFNENTSSNTSTGNTSPNPSGGSSNPGNTQPLSAQSTNTTTYAVAFNPGYGSFASGETGIRIGAYGTYINNIPVPTRSGYTFGGWLMPNGEVLSGNMHIRGDITLLAIWNVDPYATPSPNPSSSPSPTPDPGNTSARPNPQTSPIQISFMIFGTVSMAGVSALGIMKAGRKHAAATVKYRQEAARYRREKRIMDLLDE